MCLFSFCCLFHCCSTGCYSIRVDRCVVTGLRFERYLIGIPTPRLPVPVRAQSATDGRGRRATTDAATPNKKRHGTKHARACCDCWLEELPNRA